MGGIVNVQAAESGLTKLKSGSAGEEKKMKRLQYHMAYQPDVTGHVIAQREDKYGYYITKRQYNRACDKGSMIGVAPIFDTDKPVYVTDDYGTVLF